MTTTVVWQLIGIFTVVALGYAASVGGLLPREHTSRVLSAAAFTIFAPALLFRAAAQLDLGALPLSLLAAFFVPTLGWLLGTYAFQRLRHPSPPAGPSVHAITVSFGNTVQVGIPVAAALFGVAGLQLHITIVSLHALVVLTVVTALVEFDLARAAGTEDRGIRTHLNTVLTTARSTVIHPVVLPVLAGLLWNLAARPWGWQLPTPVDDVLALLGQAVVPVCLVLIGVSLAQYGVRGHLAGAGLLALSKLIAMPGIVLFVGHLVFGVSGMPLHVAVICSALPVGSNALLFAQRYQTLEGRTTAAIVVSTLAFMATLPLWLLVIAALGW
jgi:malonate transporter and related proteins